MNNQTEQQVFDDWHYQEFCKHYQDLPVSIRKQIYDRVFSTDQNHTEKARQFHSWEAAMQVAAVKQAEAVKQAKLIDIDTLDDSTVLKIAKAFYRRQLGMDELKCPVNLDEQNKDHDLLLIANMRTALGWLEVDTDAKRQLEAHHVTDPSKGIDINEYLKRYSDGDVLIVSDRDKFSSNCPSGVKAHFINHKSMWNSSDLMPFLNTVKFIHEIFIDKAFIAEVGEDSANDYIGFLIKEFKCSATVKRSKVTLDGGIFVEIDHDD